MGVFRIRAVSDRLAQRKRKRIVQSALLIALFVLAGALLDPSLIAPFGPTATRPERISARFTSCGEGGSGGGSAACVIDGDTIRLGQRRVRLIGIDAPEISGARCPAERALGIRAADRLLALVNQGDFDLVGHRFQDKDGYGRDLRLLVRGGASLGSRLTDDGLARRTHGFASGWCRS